MHNRGRRGPPRTLRSLGLGTIALATLIADPARASWLTAPCEGCEFTGGIGKAFHGLEFTGTTVPFAFTWGRNRYEFALFYFSKQFRGQEYQNRILAPQDWAVSLTRRIPLWQRGRFEAFAGAGVSFRTGDPCPNPAKTDPATFDSRPCDRVNGSQWNFAAQLGARWWEADRAAAIEIAVRHFSNAGLKEPNVGQDFVTFSYAF